MADEILFGNFQSLAEGNERSAATFALPVDTPGSTLISRRPFAQLATNELDDPPAYRYDDTDAIAYCDNVLVLWGRVFTYNHVDMARAAFADTPGHLFGNVQTHIRLLVKLHLLILGVMKRVADANGILTVPDLVGTAFANRHTQYEMFYDGAPAVALNRIWRFFRWEDVNAQADRALKSIGITTILSSAESAMVPAAGRIALATSD